MGEAIAAFGNGLDVPVAEDLSQNRDVACEPALFDMGLTPDLFDQPLLLRQAAAVLDQGQQRPKDLGLERDRASATQEPTVGGVETERTELKHLQGIRRLSSEGLQDLRWPLP